MKTAKQLRAEARKALTGHYWLAFLAALISLVLGGYFGAASGSAAGGAAASSSTQTFAQVDPDVAAAVAVMFGVVMVISLIVGVLMIAVGGAVELGYNVFNLSLYQEDGKPTVGMLFGRFGIFGKALGLRLLMILKIVLWSLLFCIPGIIATYRYAMAPYLMAENTALSASEAINLSKTMMVGNKWRLFCLELSFIGWILLGCLTLGLGIYFVLPYIKAAETAFYLELKGKTAAAA